jgi:hypothetical protein
MRALPVLASLLFTACSSDPAPRTTVSADTTQTRQDTLPMRRRPTNGVLLLGRDTRTPRGSPSRPRDVRS